MKTTSLAVVLCVTLARAGFAAPEALEAYNVAWDAPGGEMASMPIGNGELTSNVWLDKNGDLVFYLGLSDAWDEANNLLKLGRVRVSFAPALPTVDFIQKLDLRRGMIEVSAGETTDRVSIRIWVDAHHPVLRVEQSGGIARTCTVKAELWRTSDGPYKVHRTENLHSSNLDFARVPDTVIEPEPGDRRILWCHRNTHSIYPYLMKSQHLASLMEKHPDPLLNRTFGVAMSGDGMKAAGALTLVSAVPANNRVLSFTALTAQTPTLKAWKQAILAQADTLDKLDLDATRAAHETWWKQFWNRSWIFVSGSWAGKLPVNALPVHVGVDSTNRNRFAGDISDPLVLGRALTPEEIASLAGRPRQGDTRSPETPDMNQSCTFAAWIKPAANERGRILDKLTPGGTDGLLLDTHPGASLRWIVGKDVLQAANCLQADQWQHVAATADAVTGIRRIFLNGKLLRESSLRRGDIDGQIVTRGYTLQRYMIAASSRGIHPPKFNGGAFTVDMSGVDLSRGRAARFTNSHGVPDSPDFRQWGGCWFWFQNNRFLAWPSLASGDFDAMMPLFRMYRQMLDFRKDVTKTYFGHEGAYYLELAHFWGGDGGWIFGWTNETTTAVNPFLRYEWQGSLEITQMMLDAFDYFGDENFLRDTLLPIADAVVTFYDQHWERDANGKIRLDPTQALENQFGVNDAPSVAGLHAVLPRLLALPEASTTASQRNAWRKTLGDLPPIPIGTSGDNHVILWAEKLIGRVINVQNPELYPVFPYRLYGMGLPNLQLARDTFSARKNRHQYCWSMDCIHAANLGLTDEARSRTLDKFSATSAPQKFPAFWNPNPNFDWMPDMDHGGTAALALSEMLMQCPDREKILLFPAWPKDWDVDFKLHAPQQTTVEGRLVDGTLVDLNVTPASRRKDVVIPPYIQ